MPYNAYRSGVFTIEASVYKTDRLNETREDISRYLTHLGINGDVDRSGPKLECTLTTWRDVIDDGDWIAPYLTYEPETGDAVIAQMGHYLLDPPEVEYDGTETAYASSTGVDILELLNTATLPVTFYTPPGGNLMQDVRLLIQMATRGYVGANMVSNASFEAESNGTLTSWSNNGTFAGGGTGSIGWLPGGTADIPSGERVWSVNFNPSQPAGSSASVYQDITLPSHLIGQRVWVSGLWLPGSNNHRGILSVDFYDASNALIAGKSIRTPEIMRPINQWNREHAQGLVPENAVRARLRVMVKDALGGFGASQRSSWDDIAFHTITGEPLPDSRVALPMESIKATTRIQSEFGTSYLVAIDDRLRAAGYHELMTTMDGRLTARKLTELAQDAVARTYGPENSQVMDVVRVERDISDRYNMVTAIKEDVSAGLFLSTVVVNRNPADPWSIYGPKGQVPVEITVQDAVNIEALEAAANEHLARAMEREILTFGTLPDPTLTLHDVIEMDADNRTSGRWGVTWIEWGTSEADPLVRIGARRTLRGAA